MNLNTRRATRAEPLWPWLIVLPLLVGITYLAVVDHLAAIGVLVVLVAVMAIWRNPPVAVLFYVVPLLVGEQALAVLLSQDQGNTLQKAALIAVTILCALLAGVRKPPAAVFLVIGTYLVFLVVSLLFNLKAPQSISSFLTSTAGYLIPGLIFFVNWRRVSVKLVMRAITLVPIATLLFSVVLDAAGIIPLFTAGTFDMSRLGGTLPPAYLGAAGAFGAIASFWLWLNRAKGAFLTLIIGVLVAAASATRGPVVVMFFVILCMLLFTRRLHSKMAGLIRIVILGALTAGAGQIAPVLIERTTDQDQYHGGGLSGRNLAWDYFWSRFLEEPWLGHGPGANALLSQESSVQLVRQYFIAPHNTYLQLLVDFGIVGAILIGLGIVLVFVSVARRLTERRDKVLVVSLGLAMLFYAFFDNVLAAPQIYIPMALILASLSAHGKAAGAEAETEPGEPETAGQDQEGLRKEPALAVS